MLGKPYDRFEYEGVKPWEAFMIFRDLGVHRSLSTVANQLSKSLPLISRWAKQFQWRARVLAWDQEQDCVRQAAHHQVVAKAATRTAEAQELTTERVLRKTGQIAFAEPAQVVSWEANGTAQLIPTRELDPDTKAAVSEVTFGYDETGTPRITRLKFTSQQQALDKLGQHLKLWGTTKKDSAEVTQRTNFLVFIEMAKSGQLNDLVKRITGEDMPNPEETIEIPPPSGGPFKSRD